MKAREVAKTLSRLWFGTAHADDCTCPAHVRLAYRPRREGDPNASRADGDDPPPVSLKPSSTPRRSDTR